MRCFLVLAKGLQRSPCPWGSASPCPSLQLPAGDESWACWFGPAGLRLSQMNPTEPRGWDVAVGTGHGQDRAGCRADSGGSRSDRCFSPLQNEMLNRQIQKEIWRIQDVMEGLRKNNPSRGTDTAKHRGEQAQSLPCMAQTPACHSLGHPP